MRKFGIATVLGLMMFATLGATAALADHTGSGTEWTCDVEQNGGPCLPGDRNPIGPAAENALAPVGRHIMPEDAPGHAAFLAAGFDSTNGPAAEAIVNNPLCPFHQVEVTP